MPEWYKKWRLQRPGQETSLITDRPSEFYQLEVPEFKIPTVKSSEEVLLDGFNKWRYNKKVSEAKNAYDTAYKEYLEQHPVSRFSDVAHEIASAPAFPGDASFSQLSTKPSNLNKEEAYKYAVEKSGYDPGNPNDIWKATDELRDQMSLEGSKFAIEFPLMLATGAGVFGNIAKTAMNLGFAYDGYKGLTSPDGWRKTRDLINQGRYGRAALSAAGDLWDLSLITSITRPITRPLGNLVKETFNAAKFNLTNRGSGFRTDYPWQNSFKNIKSGLPATLSSNVNRTFNIVPQIGKTERLTKTYKKPSTELIPLKDFFTSADQSYAIPFYRGTKPMYSTITSGYGFSQNALDQAKLFEGFPTVDYERPFHGGVQGVRLYINEPRLKQTIGQYKDLYTRRLGLPKEYNIDQVYDHMLQNPLKIDMSLSGETYIPQDVVGLNFGYGIKDAMLFADPKLEDKFGVYREAVPDIYKMLKKRLDSGNLKRTSADFNGSHISWKFNWGMMDDWKRKQLKKMPLPGDIIQ